MTAIGHGTFLIQMDGLNILTDPIWSDRCSPVSWAGPKRYRAPGVRFEELPPIDAVLVSHNHYDHLDVPTLKRLAQKGAPCAITPLGNRDLIIETGIPEVDELDWWQSVRLSEGVTVTMVPAQHFPRGSPGTGTKLSGEASSFPGHPAMSIMPGIPGTGLISGKSRKGSRELTSPFCR